MRNRAFAVLCALAASLGTAFAQDIAPLPVAPPAADVPSGPLRLEDVLASSRQHAPQVLEALARVRGAQGKRLSAEGAFDTVFSADADTRLSGYYDGRSLETKVLRPLEQLGGNVYGGYRVSDGRFPIYEDKSYTNQLGEIKAGVVLALLRDRAIDERRFNRTQADVDIALADADRLLIAIGVQRRALDAYNQWVAAGQRLSVVRDLLGLAQDRQKGLERQVSAGLRPRIILTENQQNILRRQTLVVQAEQALAAAANTLSLYWRDSAGQPMVPTPAHLPPALPTPLPLPADPKAGLAARPDLRTIDLRMQVARERLALDRNALLPRLDFNAEASRDIGEIGEGGVSREGTETRVGLTFTVPLQRRAARGRIVQTQAEIEAAMRRGQSLREQIIAEIDTIGVAVDATGRLLTLATDEQARAQDMAQAERRRFEMGASDFFLVNLREEAAADAALRRLDTAYRQLVAHADLVAVSADVATLGL
ncbi:TolC family protein [Sphingobium algorifonticola]|uniref:Multidrug transporter n=1 Tax=Sphingobium algorifonticola TaxID=2008318 RepID=A0A437J5R9_9SPHN|nr:TolC family protein [Sphingobium algorifonticola]RVT40289.1 multidrug transporter [Sphingobium algorifonticola]